MGDLKELGGTFTNVVVTPHDTWKDHWNNAVGRKIGVFAKENNLSEEQMASLILDAFKSKKMIGNDSDARIVLDENPTPDWSEPSSDWKNLQINKMPQSGKISH